jgi:hypothetical protein
MARQGLQGRSPKRKRRSLTRPDKAAAPIPDLIGREFSAETPDQRWCEDLTDIPTDEGKLYLATVLDLASRRLPGVAEVEALSPHWLVAPAVAHHDVVILHPSRRPRVCVGCVAVILSKHATSRPASIHVSSRSSRVRIGTGGQVGCANREAEAEVDVGADSERERAHVGGLALALVAKGRLPPSEVRVASPAGVSRSLVK